MFAKRIGRFTLRIQDVESRELTSRWRQMLGQYEQITLTSGKKLNLSRRESRLLDYEITKYNQAVEVYGMCRGLGLKG